jgi:seryl-tRNA synthetase
MIDIKDLRENPDKYRRGAELKGVAVDLAPILQLDDSTHALQREFDQLKSEQNELSRQIGKADPAQREALKSRAAAMKPRLHDLEQRRKSDETARDQLLLTIPQPPDDDVPPGKDVSDNVVLYTHGQPRSFEFKPKNHIELGKALDLFDFEAGVNLAGSRSYFLKGIGAEMHQAVLRLALDMMVREKGFTPLTVPVLVRDLAMQGTGFFPASREQAYHVSQDDLFLTGTAEVALTAYHMNQTLEESSLPLRYVAVSTCFRREAGTYGKDTAGLYRVHQFDKVEQVVICRNDVAESKRWH